MTNEKFECICGFKTTDEAELIDHKMAEAEECQI